MVYIGSDGKISEGSKPWGMSRLIDTLWAPLNFLALFFQTLVPGSNNGSGGASRYSIGGMPAGSSSSAARRPPSYSSRFRTMSQIAPPAPSCRSCM